MTTEAQMESELTQANTLRRQMEKQIPREQAKSDDEMVGIVAGDDITDKHKYQSSDQLTAGDGTGDIFESEEEIKESVEMVIELPRDILTAWILCRLNGRWDDLGKCGKASIMMGLIGVYIIQYMVFAAYVTNIDYHQLAVSDTDSGTWWYTLVALCVLFMYLWRDVISFYNSVWFWVEFMRNGGQDKGAFKSLSRFKDIKGLGSGLVSGVKGAGSGVLAKAKDAGSGMKNIGSGMKNLGSGMKNMGSGVMGLGSSTKWWQFRLGLLSVFVLYFGFAMYSIVAIGGGEDLLDKIEVAISVFFVLEIDDCACELFILGPGVLDDGDFDVSITIEESQKDANDRVERRLKWTSIIVFTSIFACYVPSLYKYVIPE